MADISFQIDDMGLYKKICGFKDNNLKEIETHLKVSLIPRGNTIIIKGEELNQTAASKLLHVMSDFLHEKDEKYEFDRFDLRYLSNQILSGKEIKLNDLKKLKVYIPESGKSVLPKSVTQAHYISEIVNKSVTFGIGPAGTGKTYLAVAVALSQYYSGKVGRIILTRPAVEAGESLGYLPGDFVQKVNPYLRPLYDALFDLASFEKVSKLIEDNTIEIAPLAYMRGRTLNNAFIILDEAQNTTLSQMKMFLTRLGTNSKMVISGDITQIDIDKPNKSGLLLIRKILKSIPEISFVKFTKDDICRHHVVEKIVAAFDKHTI